MKRFMAVALALAFLLPLCLSFSALASSNAGHKQEKHSPAAAPETHCPSEMPDAPTCTNGATPMLTLEQLSPKPDSTGLFGAVPALAPSTAQLPRLQDSPAPDLQQLSITRV